MGFIRLDDRPGRASALALTDAGVLLLLDEGFLLFEEDFAQSAIEIDDWGALRRATVTSPVWAKPFRRSYAAALGKEFFADSGVREFADFFGYVAAQWQDGFPGLKYFVGKQLRMRPGS